MGHQSRRGASRFESGAPARPDSGMTVKRRGLRIDRSAGLTLSTRQSLQHALSTVTVRKLLEVRLMPSRGVDKILGHARAGF